MAALEYYGIAEQVADRLVLGENVAQAAQFAESGGADVGIIALSLARSPPLQTRGRFWEVPLAAHPRLEQVGVLLRGAQYTEECAAFAAFMCSPEGRAILAQFGFREAEDRAAVAR
jgi:molybdate transport system substrate-binding protein